MWSACVWMVVSAVAADNATLSTLDGKSFSGTVTALSASEVELSTSAGPEKFTPKQLATIRWNNVERHPTPPVGMELSDGTTLVGSSVQMKAGNATLAGLHTGEIVLPRRSIGNIRFQHEPSAGLPAWKEALTTKAAGDLLIVRKTVLDPDGGAPTISLDPLEGIVRSISDQTVGFDFDGDEIQVKLEKVEGILLFRPAAPAALPVICKANSAEWGSFQVVDLKWVDSKCEVTSASGAKALLSPSAGLILDYRAGNILWLADTEPDLVRSSFHLQPPGMTFGFDSLFRPDAAGPFGGRGLKLGKRVFESGLSLHSPTTIAYGIPAGFTRFQATLGLAEEAGNNASVSVRIVGDADKLFWEGTLSAGGSRKPVELECKLEGSRRLTITLEADNGLDIGDVIILGDARFIK